LAAAPAAPAKTSGQKNSDSDLLLLTGEILTNGNFQPLQSAYRLGPEMFDPLRLKEFQACQSQFTFQGATYSLDQMDSNGKLLASQVFEPFPAETPDDTANPLVCLLVPFNNATVKLQVSHNGSPLATIPVTPNAPVVKVATPTGGPFSKSFVVQ